LCALACVLVLPIDFVQRSETPRWRSVARTSMTFTRAKGNQPDAQR
jgi:hypothetical protein